MADLGQLVTAIGTLAVAIDTAAAAVAARLGVYPPNTTISNALTPTLPLPGYLSPITDPVWGTKVTRVSDTPGVRNQYSRRSAWNADGTIIGLLDKGNPSTFLDGRTYAFQKTMQRGTEPVWSNVDPDKLYTTNGSNAFQKCVYSTGAITTLHTFAGYSNLTIGGYEGTPSNDDRYVALQGTVGGVKKVIVYDILDDAIVSGTWAYPRDLSAGIQLQTNTTHGDLGVDAAGNDVFVAVNTADGLGRQASIDLATGALTRLFPAWNAFSYGHASCRNLDRPGWAYLSNSKAEGLASYGGVDQVAAVKLDGSGTLEVFAHAHQTVPDNPTYGWDPMATVSRDGTRVLFGSDWGATNVYAYVAEAA